MGLHHYYTYTFRDDGKTLFFDQRGNSEYCCRLGFNSTDKIDINNADDECDKILLTKTDAAIQSDQVRCSERKSLFDVYLKVSPGVEATEQKIVGSVHGRFFKHLAETLHLQSCFQLVLTIKFNEPLNRTVDTGFMDLISDPRDKLWPKAFKFEMELNGGPWKIPRKRTMEYSLEAMILATPFKESARGLGIIPHEEDGETAEMNKKFLDKRAHCDFTLLSENAKDEVHCHKMFLAESSPFFDRMINGNMKEAKENKCRLDGSTKDGIEALLKFLYYRGVEDALNSSIIAYELLDLAQKYDIPRLEGTMSGLLEAKLDDWWDLEVAIKLFLSTRLMDGKVWKNVPLENKAKEVVKMKKAALLSNSNTLLNDLMAKDPEAAKELIGILSEHDD